MSSDALLAELIRKPVGPAIPIREPGTEAGAPFTRRLHITGDTAEVTVRTNPHETGDTSETDEATARVYLARKGEDPDAWVAMSFRSSEWTMPNGEIGQSDRYTFARRTDSGSPGTEVPLDELFAEIRSHQPSADRPDGDYGLLVLLGDMQFGKVDGDGAAGSLGRTIGCLNRAADRLAWYRGAGVDIGHVHLGWLGDHIEGFVSQGGAQAWRTGLTLTDQIRLTRRVMLHALTLFAPLADKVSMVAVPGNHGEAVRFSGSGKGQGVTRYDDSHDTESLIAVADAAALNRGAFAHVEFFVPDDDELTVIIQVAGTTIAHAHGHQWKTGKHFEWWRGQAFHDPGPHQADLLVAGHRHHEFVDTDGQRTFIQVPAMESESTWWRHATGTTGAPGLLLALTNNGRTDIKEIVRP